MTPQCHVADVMVNPIYSLVTNFPTDSSCSPLSAYLSLLNRGHLLL